MFRIHQFAAFRPIPAKSADISCEPGGRLSLAEAMRRLEEVPNTWLPAVRADLRQKLGDPHAGVKQFERLKASKWLVQDPLPQMYVYRQVRGEKKSVALIAAMDLSENFLKGILRLQAGDAAKAQETSEQDRQLGAHAEIPLFAFMDQEELGSAIRGSTIERPLAHFLGKDGATHTIWACRETALVTKLVNDLKSLVAVNGDELYSAEGASPGRPPARAMALVEFEHISIHASHLIVQGGDEAALEKKLAELLESGCAKNPENPGMPPAGFFDAYLRGTAATSGKGSWIRCRIPPAKPGHSPAANWERTRFERGVLEPLLSAGNQVNSPRKCSVSATISPTALAQMVDSGEAAAAFVFAIPSMEDLLEIARGGEGVPHGAITVDLAVPSGLFIQPIE
ncbi:MAG: DUF1015 domain-containing protein [Planctomycetes bacterium]|nr:DUF1015 domain-containing protein [Planctomycetota bacterium]